MENGRLLGKANPATSTTTSGLWLLREQHLAINGSNWPLPMSLPSNVRSMLHLDGSLTDSAGVTWTNNGSATFSTTVYKFGTGSLQFSGGQKLTTSTTFDVSGLKPFTFEAWFYPQRVTGGSDYEAIFATSANSSTYPAGCWLMQNNSSLRWSVGSGSLSSWAIDGNYGTLTAATWHHVAVCGDGSTIRLFLNGTQLASVTHPNWSFTGTPMNIGGVTGLNSLYGHLDEIRIATGTGAAYYTANFTAPSAPFGY